VTVRRVAPQPQSPERQRQAVREMAAACERDYRELGRWATNGERWTQQQRSAHAARTKALDKRLGAMFALSRRCLTDDERSELSERMRRAKRAQNKPKAPS
jgi:hypothetical protein